MPTPKKQVKTFEVNIVYIVAPVDGDKLTATLKDEKRIWKDDYKHNVMDGTTIKKFSIKEIK